MQISFIDIKRAYFNAKVDEDCHTYVQLPQEDGDHGTMCAKLLRHMYGTRAAADGWQEEYPAFLVEELGFTQGLSSACVFSHPERSVRLSVHGDDFTACGEKEDLDWYEDAMTEHYECTIQPRIGPSSLDAKEAVVLNRVIRWTTDGLEMEADPRQTEKLLAECGLTGANSVATPGQRLTFSEVEQDTPLSAKIHTAFRGSAARANYLAADRVDVQFSAKEICRWMSKPTEQSWQALKRRCRYLAGLPRMVYKYSFQSAGCVEVYTDTDWAGCPRTRKSTSGGALMIGSHLIKSWSSTQSSVALSSGEAEFNGVVRGAGIGLGYRSMLQDFGHDLPVRVWTDSSAAIGICGRQGLGKLRHLDTHTLWVQQAVRTKRIMLCKIDGERNPADLLTKHSLTRDRMMHLTSLFDCVYRGGRSAAAPACRAAPGDRATMSDIMVMSEAPSQGEQGEQLLRPYMPHRALDAATLMSRHPPLEVPDEVDAGDPQNDDNEELVIAGDLIIRDIISNSAAHGRRRRPVGGVRRREGGGDF